MTKTNIILIGLMGAGKTTVARELSRLASMPYIDTDTMIEERVGKSIQRIFEEDGKEFFRKIESEIIRKISQEQGKIIAVGGGAFESEENRDSLSKTGTTFYLQASPEILLQRIQQQPASHRPLLDKENPLQTLEKLLHEREGNYLRADCVVDTTSLSSEEIAEKILALLTP